MGGDQRKRIAELKAVGNYAFGITWGDGHDSIIPHRSVRLACPCDVCAATPPPAALELGAERPIHVETLGEASLFVRFADGHETVLLTDELRALCRCAYCAGEPQYPISGR